MNTAHDIQAAPGHADMPEVDHASSDRQFVQSSVAKDGSLAIKEPQVDLHADRRIMGAAATVGATAGSLAIGPAAGMLLGAAALYASTREDASGALARKVGSVYLQASDAAVDTSLQVVDRGAKKAARLAEDGCRRLSKEVRKSAFPTPVRANVCAVLDSHATPARKVARVSEEAKKIRDRYPDRVPVICERSPFSTDLPALTKSKFIVSGTMLCSEFKYMIHKHLAQHAMSPEQTIYLFINGLAPKTNAPMSELYSRMGSEDGFLYVKFAAETTLG